MVTVFDFIFETLLFVWNFLVSSPISSFIVLVNIIGLIAMLVAKSARG